MAVVFISPKQQQKIFFLGITIIFLLFLIIVFLGVFLSKPKEVSPLLVFNKPKVNIDMTIFDSIQFRDLQLFPEMEMQYSYTAFTKDNKTQTGFISAVSIDQAKEKLKNMGLTVSDIRESEVGRGNPFMPYYTVTAPATSTR
jgi:predicted tellurium resistance membrane protein TerC